MGKNLQQYIQYYVAKKLNTRLYSVEDLVQEVNLFLCTNEQLRPYLEENIIPVGRDLSFLKAVMSRQKMKFINYTNERRFGSRKANTMKVMELIQLHRLKGDA